MGLNEMNKIVIRAVNNASCRRTEGFDSNCISSSEPSEELTSSKIPAIAPCYNGKTLKIHEELVLNGLSAISIKHHNGNCKDEKCESEDSIPRKSNNNDNKGNEGNHKDLRNLRYQEFSKTSGDVPECLKDKIKRRNSFWNIHQPELSKLTWPENFVSSTVLQDFFHNHLRIHGTFCEPLHEFTNRSSLMDEEFRDYCKLREIVPPRILPPDEKIVSIMEKSRSVQINDEDLDPETQVHKSRAEFCVTIGEYVRRSPLKRTTSQVMPKCVVQHPNRFESLPLQHEGLLSKETMMSEERVSAVIGNTDFSADPSSMHKNSKKLSSGLALRCASFVDSQRMVATSPPSLNNLQSPLEGQTNRNGNGQGRLRTILGPREEAAQESGKRNFHK